MLCCRQLNKNKSLLKECTDTHYFQHSVCCVVFCNSCTDNRWIVIINALPAVVIKLIKICYNWKNRYIKLYWWYLVGFPNNWISSISLVSGLFSVHHLKRLSFDWCLFWSPTCSSTWCLVFSLHHLWTNRSHIVKWRILKSLCIQEEF